MPLTDKQMNFVNEYMKDMNATAAYLRAGYQCSEEAARRAASRLLTNVDVQDEIGQRQDKIREESDISVKWVLENLKYVAERCMAPEPLTDKEGNIIEWKFDSSGANKALENIGKHLGMFTDKVKLDLQGEVNHNYEYNIEQIITTDSDSAELLKQLWKRQASTTQ